MKEWGNRFPSGQIFFGGRGVANLLEPPNHPRHYAYTIIYPGLTKYYLKAADCLCSYLEEVDSIYGGQHYPRLSSDDERSRHWMAFVLAYVGQEANPTQKALECIGEYYPALTPDCISRLTKGLPLAWGRGGVGTWWRTMDRRPTRDGCPGTFQELHPVNGTWCQVCGWTESWIEIEGLKYEITEILHADPDEGHFFALIETGGGGSFFLACSMASARAETRTYWRWLAKEDPQSIITALGERTLAHWALGEAMRPAIPDAPEFYSFEGFLEWLGNNPETVLSKNYCARKIDSYAESLEQDLGFRPMVAFRRS